ncbi:MAG TPA: alpha/beta hydrolase family protein [Opitutaceae bacterium]|nr:alpha/beta hydrolase family protein [Opitutaceae bacterium]
MKSPAPLARLGRRLALAASLLLPAAAWAQASAAPAGGPDPKEIPLPPIQTDLPALPGVDALKPNPGLPDIMTMDDGTKVTTPEQWQKRREEMRAILAYYAVGRMPPAPGNVKGEEMKSEVVANGAVKYRLVHLTFGPEEKLSLNIGVFTPSQGGPFPAIILQSFGVPGAPVLPRLPQGPNQGRGQDVLLMVGRPPAAAASAGGTARAARRGGAGGAVPGFGGPASAESMAGRYAEVFKRGYALVVYNPNDCAEDTTLREQDGSWSFRHTRFFPAYPGYDWGVLAAWAWGASRVADFLQTDPAIDSKIMIITGASRDGKSSMIAAAFDDRLLGAPVVTGGGGIGAYRVAGPRNSETLDIMQKKYPNWFSPHLHQFWGQREKLPFDEHWFLALCAPRPFVALEGNRDTISYPFAVKASIEAARAAYALLGHPDNLGIHYSQHAHAFTPEDWTAMMDFFDQHARGMPARQRFDHFLTDQEIDAAAAAARAP